MAYKPNARPGLLCRCGLHAYRAVFESGAYEYLECRRANCRHRFAVRIYDGHSPLDWDWLHHLPPSPPTPIPFGGTGVKRAA